MLSCHELPCTIEYASLSHKLEDSLITLMDRICTHLESSSKVITSKLEHFVSYAFK